MKIRPARLEDLDRIVAIELENFSVEEAIPRSVFEAHLREIQTSFLVAEKEGRIMGYIEGPVGPHRHPGSRCGCRFFRRACRCRPITTRRQPPTSRNTR